MLDFVCDREAASVLSRFWAVAGIHSGEGRTYPSPWGPPSTRPRVGVVSNTSIGIEIWKIDDFKSRVRLSTERHPFNESEQMELLLRVQSELESVPEERALMDSVTASGFSYVASSRNELNAITREIDDLIQEESLALRTDTGSVVLRGVSSGLIDVLRKRLVTVYDHLPISMGNPTIQPCSGATELPLEAIPGVTVLHNLRDVFSLDVSPDGQRVATLEWNAGGYLEVFDVSTGLTQLAMSLADIAGDERPAFSPDGEWLLIPGYHGARLVRCSEGATIHLPQLTHGVCWYELDNTIGLLSIGAGSGDDSVPERVNFINLETLTARPVGDVVAADPELPYFRRGLSDPISGQDGRVLVGSCYGPPADYQNSQGSRRRVAILDLGTMTLTHPVAPFALADQNGVIEREHKMWSWNSPLVSARTLEISDSLLESAVPRSPDADPGEDEYRRQTVLVVDFSSPLITGNWD
jgi:hypothetical protein